MPHDLSSVPGLLDSHRRALAAKLGITSLRALADADQRDVQTALRNVRPYASLARVAAWQDDARRKLSAEAIGGSAWHTAASFAVIFAQRRVNGGWERRIDAEQTELEPPPEPRQWQGWDCGPLCDWMLGQLGMSQDQAAAGTGEPGAAGAAGAAAGGELAGAAEVPVGGTTPRPAVRGVLRIDSATLTDAAHELPLVRGGALAPAPPEGLTPPVRLRFTVTGGRSGQQLRAAAWFRRQASPGWSPHEPVTVAPTGEPVTVPPTGQVEFDLPPVPPGEHTVRLLAWATDASATLAGVTLPTLTFGRQEDREAGPVST